VCSLLAAAPIYLRHEQTNTPRFRIPIGLAKWGKLLVCHHDGEVSKFAGEQSDRQYPLLSMPLDRPSMDPHRTANRQSSLVIQPMRLQRRIRKYRANHWARTSLRNHDYQGHVNRTRGQYLAAWGAIYLSKKLFTTARTNFYNNSHKPCLNASSTG
jgi:hypothetical protein